MRVLEVSLRKAGFTVTTAVSVKDALDKLELGAPDLIISETTFTDGDGFELRRRVRAQPEWNEIPFIFLTAEAAIENKIRGLELGVDDYLTKPIYIKEIVTRINILLQKRQRARFEERRDGRTRFAGRVADMPVVDVIQTVEISRKSGVIQFVGERNRQAAIYFRDGRVIDAEAGNLQGEDAVYRLLTWSDGDFEVVFRTVRRREVITTSSQGLLMEGMRRLDEWSRLLEQLPPLTHRFEVDASELATRLGDVPDDNNQILRLIDGKRTLLEVIDASDVGDLECLQAISRLYFEEMLLDLDDGMPSRSPPVGRPAPLVEVPTPIEESASGPIVAARAASEGTPVPATPDEAASPATPTPPAPTDVVAEGSGPMEPPAAGSGDQQEVSLEDLDEADLPTQTEPSGPVEEVVAVESSQIEEEVPGELLGGYRPSSLRLIDEAVAAAQAIEPSLFENDGVPERVEADDIEEISDANVEIVMNIPSEIDADYSPPRRVTAADATTLGNDDSGLRMIGSLGRDRAETFGEIKSSRDTTSPEPETQRELVTILPRRITREMKAVSGEPDEAEAFAKPAVAPMVTVPAIPSIATHRPPRIAPGGSGVRRQTGPGKGAIALLVLAGILGLVAVYLYVTRPHRSHHRTRDAGIAGPIVTPIADANTLPPPIEDAAEAPVVADAASVDAAAPPPVDAAPVAPRPDAAAPIDDPMKQAKALYDQAVHELEESNFDTALELVDRSLALRRTARSYLLRARALERLGHVDQALDALTHAEKTFPIPAIYEMRARIYKAAGRNAEARDAIMKYLDMVPDRGRTVKLFKQWLEEMP